MRDAFDASTRIAIDALHAHVAVLDRSGRILAVNERWRRFGRQNGATSDYVGVSYLDVCARAADEGDARAARVQKGLLHLLNGEGDQFGVAYPCAKRSFRLRASRLAETDARLLVAHEDITALVQARRERDAAAASLVQTSIEHTGLMADVYEELGQRLAAIRLAAAALVGGSPTALATIRLAVDEASHEMRRLRHQPGPTRESAAPVRRAPLQVK